MSRKNTRSLLKFLEEEYGNFTEEEQLIFLAYFFLRDNGNLFNFSEKQVQEYFGHLPVEKIARYIVLLYYTNDERIWFKDTNIPVTHERCYSPWYMVNVMPNGDINFCCDFGDYIIGNITQEPLLDIWFNKKAMKFREEIMKERFSICKRCGVKLLFLYNRMPFYTNAKILSKIVKLISKIPLLKKRMTKYRWLINAFY